MLVVVASMRAKEGREKELEELAKAMIPKVQQEEGTLKYTLHRSKNDPRKFLYYEMYQDKAALGVHASTEYFKEFEKSISDLIEEKLKIDFYEDIASINR
jgi:quinol monooxygenase YgiN